MANVLTSNVWTLDTVSAIPFWTGMVWVEEFEFIDYTADGDTCQIKDGFGRVMWEGNGAADFRPVKSGKIGTCHGLAFTVNSNAAARVRVSVK